MLVLPGFWAVPHTNSAFRGRRISEMETDPLEGANSADVEAALFLLLCGPSLFSLFNSSNKAVLFSAAQRN